MKWETIPTGTPGSGYQLINGKACTIYLEPRPDYCDRGNFLAKIFLRDDVTVADARELNLDEQDGWLRYFMDEARAKAEIEAWLVKRKQAIP